jgi:hypothetical protein
MRPNLTFENFVAVLAAVGTSTIVACGGATPQPVQANEVTPTSTTPAGNASCSAKGCGASTTAAASPSTVATAPAVVTPATPPTDAAAVAMPSATAAPAATLAATPPVAQKKAPPKANTAQAPKKKPASGEASCGAGTCAATPTQKIL